MINSKYISPIIVGFGAAVLSVVPVVKSFGCCLMIPLAAYLSLMLDQKATSDYSQLEIKKCVIFGLLTGVTAAILGTAFDTLITIITHKNDLLLSFPELLEAINNFPIDEATREEVVDLLSNVVDQIRNSGFSPLYTISLFVNNVFADSVFGILGGIIGVQILNSRNSRR